MTAFLLQTIIALTIVGLLWALASLLAGVQPGGILSTGLILLLRELLGLCSMAAYSLIIASVALLTGLQRLSSRLILSLGITARFNSLILILHHTFKVPDGLTV
jgi:hypothetical protein